MLYKFRKRQKSEKFNQAIAGIYSTPPVRLGEFPVTLVSMVANRDVPMYLLAIKSVFPALRPRRVIAIIDRDMPEEPRAALQRHVEGIEFAILEDIDTGPCQRGGTWERVLFCIDQSATEYVIQIDADCLFVGPDMNEVIACVEANRAFTMSDGHQVVSFPRAAELAERTDSRYMGILSERAFGRFPEAERWRYVRGSSGFAGFARGGIDRGPVNHFHAEMEKLVGRELWTKWGSEQCASNFAVANSPDPVVLPHPEYTSFPPHGPRHMCKFYHFIGASRYRDGYYVAKGNELIAQWKGQKTAAAIPDRPWPPTDEAPAAFLRSLTLPSAARYLRHKLLGGADPIVVQQRHVSVHESASRAGPKFELRPRSAGNNDGGVAYEVFMHNYYFPPGWIPPETVDLVVDLGANVGMSCLFWLANYPDCRVVAFEPHPKHADQCMRNVRLNNWVDRLTLHRAAASTADGTATLSDEGSSSRMDGGAPGQFEIQVVDVFRELQGQRIDILKIDIEGHEVALMEDPRFAELDIGAIAMEWHAAADGKGGKAWTLSRLEALGYWVIDIADMVGAGMIWAYKREPVSAIASRESSCSVSAAQ